MKIQSQDFISFVTENYKNLTISAMSKKLKTSPYIIRKIIEQNGLTLSEDQKRGIFKMAHLKHPDKERVKSQMFKIIDTPEKAYILGILWADGHVNNTSVSISILKEDMNLIEEIFFTTGNWSKGEYVRNNPNCKPMTSLYTSNMRLCEILKELDYNKKSGTSSNKVLDYIPKKLLPYWWRGYFDGDGYVHLKGRAKRITISSSLDQNWEFVENLFKQLSIKYSIDKRISKNRNSSGSIIKITHIHSIFLFFNFLYNKKLKKLGFKRKRNKFIDIFLKKQSTKSPNNFFLTDMVFEKWI